MFHAKTPCHWFRCSWLHAISLRHCNGRSWLNVPSILSLDLHHRRRYEKSVKALIFTIGGDTRKVLRPNQLLTIEDAKVLTQIILIKVYITLSGQGSVVRDLIIRGHTVETRSK